MENRFWTLANRPLPGLLPARKPPRQWPNSIVTLRQFLLSKLITVVQPPIADSTGIKTLRNVFRMGTRSSVLGLLQLTRYRQTLVLQRLHTALVSYLVPKTWHTLELHPIVKLPVVPALVVGHVPTLVSLKHVLYVVNTSNLASLASTSRGIPPHRAAVKFLPGSIILLLHRRGKMSTWTFVPSTSGYRWVELRSHS